MDRFAIEVTDLHEIFKIYKDRPPGIKERLYRFRRSDYTRFHALNGVSFSVRPGESVGIIGHNGSGKSTLLKCLAGILPADEGSVTVHGRLASLLELGAGFHGDLTGKENIYLNASILGLSRKEVDAALDDIISFAGVEDFIDTPVRNYSSGMYVRLGFAVAVHVDPDVLLVDEVLSVGDAAFQERSLQRMQTFNDEGRTVVLVSHDLASIGRLCERTLLLDHGRLVFDGPTEQGLEEYERIVAGGAPVDRAQDEPSGRTGDHRLRAANPRLTIDAQAVSGPVRPGATAEICFDVEALEDVTDEGSISVGINLRRPDVTQHVYETRTSWRGQYIAPPAKGASATFTFVLDLPLLTGDILVDLFVGSASSSRVHDRWLGALSFTVKAADHDYGIAACDARIGVWNPDGYWPDHLAAPPLERGGPREHSFREGDPPRE